MARPAYERCRSVLQTLIPGSETRSALGCACQSNETPGRHTEGWSPRSRPVRPALQHRALLDKHMHSSPYCTIDSTLRLFPFEVCDEGLTLIDRTAFTVKSYLQRFGWAESESLPRVHPPRWISRFQTPSLATSTYTTTTRPATS